MKTKGQVTLFILLGLLIVIVFGFLFYLIGYTAKKEGEPTVEESQKLSLEFKPINEYVIACLDTVSKDALLKVGKQGGRILISEGGTLINYEGIYDNANEHVSYALYPPSPFIVPGPWEYPWENFGSDDVRIGVFGGNNLPPLQKIEGAHSIQAQLESYITKKMPDCLDFSVFEEKAFEINAGKMETEVIIGKKDVAVHLKYPIGIKNLATGQSARVEEFYIKIQVRLKEVYNFARWLISNDITDIELDIGSPSNNKNYLAVNILGGDGTSSMGYDDIIKVTDEKSKIKGTPYSFSFARKNRIPALIYIQSPITRTLHENEELTQADIASNPQAIDPDEDINLQFAFDPQGQATSLPITNEFYYRTICSGGGGTIKVNVTVRDDAGLLDYQVVEVPCD
ncbi:hypothetical protein J4209_05725 [Candidatus Woesearchaeota archaeon]|nr:hypothetical protein [Candidatus Woesearchaeota archaeon]